MMDFVEAMKISNDMCKCYFKNGHTYPCTGCPFNWTLEYMNKENCSNYLREYPEEAEEILQKWKDEYPVETNLEHYEKVVVPFIKDTFGKENTLTGFCNVFKLPYVFCDDFNCNECKKFWNSPYREREEE